MWTLTGMWVQMVQVTWPRWPPCAYMVKPLKIFFSGTERPMILKLGMQHRVLEYYHVCSNDASGLTLTYFMAKSNLVPYPFVWEKIITMDFFRNYCSLWYKSREMQSTKWVHKALSTKVGSFIDNSLRFNSLAHLSQIPYEACKGRVGGGGSFLKWFRSRSHDQDGRLAHIW